MPCQGAHAAKRGGGMTALPREVRSGGVAKDRREDGRVSIFLTIAIAGLVAVFGVAVDATGQIRTLMRADNIAAEAARAAGQAVDVDVVAAEGRQRVNRDQAVAYANQYLTEAGHDIPDSDWSVRLTDDGTAVDITVRLTYQPRILGLFGRSDVRVTGRSRATLVTEP